MLQAVKWLFQHIVVEVSSVQMPVKGRCSMRWLVVTSGFALAGCAGGVAPSDFAPAVQAAASKVRIYTIENSNAPVGQAIGPVEAYSCQRSSLGGPPSRSDALQQLRLKAADMGADAVTEVTFDDAGTNLQTNCWSSVHAAGTAVRVGGP